MRKIIASLWPFLSALLFTFSPSKQAVAGERTELLLPRGAPVSVAKKLDKILRNRLKKVSKINLNSIAPVDPVTITLTLGCASIEEPLCIKNLAQSRKVRWILSLKLIPAGIKVKGIFQKFDGLSGKKVREVKYLFSRRAVEKAASHFLAQMFPEFFGVKKTDGEGRSAAAAPPGSRAGSPPEKKAVSPGEKADSPSPPTEKGTKPGTGSSTPPKVPAPEEGPKSDSGSSSFPSAPGRNEEKGGGLKSAGGRAGDAVEGKAPSDSKRAVSTAKASPSDKTQPSGRSEKSAPPHRRESTPPSERGKSSVKSGVSGPVRRAGKPTELSNRPVASGGKSRALKSKGAEIRKVIVDKKAPPPGEIPLWKRPRFWGLVSLGVAAASVGLAIGFGLDANSKMEQLNRKIAGSSKDKPLSYKKDLYPIEIQGKQSATLSNIFSALSVASGLSSAILFFIPPADKARSTVTHNTKNKRGQN